MSLVVYGFGVWVFGHNCWDSGWIARGGFRLVGFRQIGFRFSFDWMLGVLHCFGFRVWRLIHAAFPAISHYQYEQSQLPIAAPLSHYGLLDPKDPY